METLKIPWLGDLEQAFSQARAEQALLLLEFSQAPRCAGSVRLETEVYTNDQVVNFLAKHFVLARLLRSDHPQERQRFNIVWTPTVLILEADGTERHRLVGFLPAEEYISQIEMGLAKAAFGRGQFADAQRAFETIVEGHPSSFVAPEALYWSGVSEYRPNRDRQALQRIAQRLREKYPHSEWTTKGSVWLPHRRSASYSSRQIPSAF